MAVVVFLIAFAFPIVISIVLFATSRKAMRESGLSVGDRVVVKGAFRKDIYTIEKINAVGGCRLKKVNSKKTKFCNISKIERYVKTAPVINNPARISDRRETPIVSNDKSRNAISDNYAIPFVNCPNCGGRLTEGKVEGTYNKTCRCAYCDSVFSMLKR